MHNFKALLRIGLYLLMLALIGGILSYGLVPYNYAQGDIKRITSETFDCLFIGTSHGANNIDPEIISEESGLHSMNVCLPREFLIDSYYLVRLACESGHRPKEVVYELDPSYWVLNEPQDADSYYIYRSFPNIPVKLFYYKDKIIRLDWRFTLAPWGSYAKRFPLFFKNIFAKHSLHYRDYIQKYVDDGDNRQRDNGMIARTITDRTARYGFDKVVPFSSDKITDRSRSDFSRLVSYCRKQGIRLIVIRTPVPSATRAQNPESIRQAAAYFSSLCSENDLPYYDFSDLGDPTLEASDHYIDADGHMDHTLASCFSVILGKYLRDVGK